MKIRMLKSIVHHKTGSSGRHGTGTDYLAGQEYEVDEQHGRSWTHAGLAEAIAEPEPEVTP